MDVQDIRTLKILEELDSNKSPSQRYLSKKLNISLGLVNSFLKRLAQKGYFKITTIPRNRVKYILTPKGALEKTRLTYDYVRYSFEYYRDAKYKLKFWFNNLESENVRSIVFYGISDLTEIAYITLQETPIRLKAVVEDHSRKKEFMGFKIQPIDRLRTIAFDIILITSMDDIEKRANRLAQNHVPLQKIVAYENIV